MSVTLDKLKISSEGVIENLNSQNTLRRRMLDLGLVKNTKIKCLFTNPSKDFTAYEVRNSIIAIRKEDAKLIIIKLI